MGAGQSNGMGVGGGTMGYQVLRVYPNSPGSRAGLKAYFDFIVAIGNTVFNKENGSLREILKASVDQKLKMLVYNTRTKKVREVEILPSTSWGGNGLLGVSIKHSSFDRADERVWHVVEVEPGSPAEQAGFKANEDYVIGSDSILQENDDLYNLVEAHEGKALKLFIYNTKTDNCREIICHPNSRWGGKGYLGCEFGHGLLHRIPYAGGDDHTDHAPPVSSPRSEPKPGGTNPGHDLLQQALYDQKPMQQQPTSAEKSLPPPPQPPLVPQTFAQLATAQFLNQQQQQHQQPTSPVLSPRSPPTYNQMPVQQKPQSAESTLPPPPLVPQTFANLATGQLPPLNLGQSPSPPTSNQPPPQQQPSSAERTLPPPPPLVPQTFANLASGRYPPPNPGQPPSPPTSSQASSQQQPSSAERTLPPPPLGHPAFSNLAGGQYPPPNPGQSPSPPTSSQVSSQQQQQPQPPVERTVTPPPLMPKTFANLATTAQFPNQQSQQQQQQLPSNPSQPPSPPTSNQVSSQQQQPPPVERTITPPPLMPQSFAKLAISQSSSQQEQQPEHQQLQNQQQEHKFQQENQQISNQRQNQQDPYQQHLYQQDQLQQQFQYQQYQLQQQYQQQLQQQLYQQPQQQQHQPQPQQQQHQPQPQQQPQQQQHQQQHHQPQPQQQPQQQHQQQHQQPQQQHQQQYQQHQLYQHQLVGPPISSQSGDPHPQNISPNANIPPPPISIDFDRAMANQNMSSRN